MKGRGKRRPAAPFRVYVVDGGKAARVRATGSDIEKYEYAVKSQQLARPAPSRPSDEKVNAIVDKFIAASSHRIRIKQKDTPLAAVLRQAQAGRTDDGSPMDPHMQRLAEILAKATPKKRRITDGHLKEIISASIDCAVAERQDDGPDAG